MARLLVFVLCASMVTTQRNGNAVKNGGELSSQNAPFNSRIVTLIGAVQTTLHVWAGHFWHFGREANSWRT